MITISFEPADDEPEDPPADEAGLDATEDAGAELAAELPAELAAELAGAEADAELAADDDGAAELGAAALVDGAAALLDDVLEEPAVPLEELQAATVRANAVAPTGMSRR